MDGGECMKWVFWIIFNMCRLIKVEDWRKMNFLKIRKIFHLMNVEECSKWIFFLKILNMFCLMNGENCKKMHFLEIRYIMMFPWKLNNEFRDGSVSTNGMVGIGNGVTKTYLIRNIILVLVGVSNIFRWKPNLVCGKSPANISEYSTLFLGWPMMITSALGCISISEQRKVQ